MLDFPFFGLMMAFPRPLVSGLQGASPVGARIWSLFSVRILLFTHHLPLLVLSKAFCRPRTLASLGVFLVYVRRSFHVSMIAVVFPFS